MQICALIPAFNEAPHIANVIAGIKRHIEMIVVIDDGSGDGTADAARAAGATCLESHTNSGKGAALRAGISYARAQGSFTHVITLDGDGQHLPEDIPVMLRVAEESGADLVIGARPFARALMPRARYYSNTIGSRFTSALVGRKIDDSQSGMRIFRLDKLGAIKLRSLRYEFEMEVLIKMARAGCTIAHAPIRMVYDDGQARSKMKPIRDTVRICLWSMAFRFLGA